MLWVRYSMDQVQMGNTSKTLQVLLVKGLHIVPHFLLFYIAAYLWALHDMPYAVCQWSPERKLLHLRLWFVV